MSEGDAGAPLTTAYADARNEAQTIILSVCNKVLHWANLNTVQSFRNQGDIREAVDELHRKVGVCIASFQVRINRQLVDDTDAIRNDVNEIRETVRELLEGFTVYKRNGSTLATSAVFDRVVEEIEQESIPPANLHDDGIPESESRLFISQHHWHAFDDAMSSFCRSLISLELAQPIVAIAQTEPRNVHTPYRQPPVVSSSSTAISLMSLVRRSPSVPRIPPLDFGDRAPFFTEPVFLVEPSRVLSQVTGHSRHSPHVLLDGAITASTPLDVALTTRLNVRQYSGRPRVIIKATMEGLISYLLEGSPGEDEDLHDTFFIAHLAFISPSLVLQMLIRQYNESLVHDDQKRVLHLMRDWLNNDHVIIADGVLTEMKEFVADVNRRSDLNQLLILEVMQGIRNKASVNLPFPVIPSLRPTTGSPPTAHCLAIALASLEWEKHQRTRPIEYIAHASGQPLYSPNLSTAISLYELVKRWAQFCVLDEKFGSARDGIEQRSKMKQLLVDTAQECQNIRNFSSLCAIMSALKSEIIDSLTLTHSHMSRAAQRRYERLTGLLTSNSNFNAYRRALLRNEQMGCIPWHVVELHDIKSIMQQGCVDEEHEPPLIILGKCDGHCLRMAEAYLTDQLRHVGSREDIVLQERSRDLVDGESAMSLPGPASPGLDLLMRISVGG